MASHHLLGEVRNDCLDENRDRGQRSLTTGREAPATEASHSLTTGRARSLEPARPLARRDPANRPGRKKSILRATFIRATRKPASSKMVRARAALELAVHPRATTRRADGARSGRSCRQTLSKRPGNAPRARMVRVRTAVELASTISGPRPGEWIGSAIISPPAPLIRAPLQERCHEGGRIGWARRKEHHKRLRVHGPAERTGGKRCDRGHPLFARARTTSRPSATHCRMTGGLHVELEGARERGANGTPVSVGHPAQLRRTHLPERPQMIDAFHLTPGG